MKEALLVQVVVQAVRHIIPVHHAVQALLVEVHQGLHQVVAVVHVHLVDNIVDLKQLSI